MPEDLKKNLDKKKNEPKDQRKPRHTRNQGSKVDKKPEKSEESRFVPKVPQKPPVYEDPGPEFYKNLKRETEEILKITEEENSKYKKKEIQSNWSKYEMPIESYDEIEEHDIGADYEKLIQAPLSIGNHFQFKHEKSWDTNTGPSLYDKYFDINMENLSLAVSTIPFYERNSVDTSIFSETDILSMNNRATKYKQKYYDDKTFSTPETEAQDKILDSFKESLSKNSVENIANSDEKVFKTPDNEEDRSVINDINLDFNTKDDFVKTDVHSSDSNKEIENNKYLDSKSCSAKIIDDIDVLLDSVPKSKQETLVEKVIEQPESLLGIDTKKNKEITKVQIATKTFEAKEIKDEPATVQTAAKTTEVHDIPVETKNPVIESPEDLEKWLDDFLDG